MYSLRISENAKKDLVKLDKQCAKIIVSWLKKNLENTTNPRALGKPLKGKLKGMWRYRVGDYRILSLIKDNELIVLVITVGHRKDVYEQ